MDRRQFLAGLAAAPALSAFQAPAASAGRLRIAAVEVVRVEGSRPATTGVNQQFQVNPLHVYDELRPKPYHDAPSPGQRTRTPLPRSI